MTLYAVINKVTQAEVSRYDSPSKTETVEWPFDEFLHVEIQDDVLTQKPAMTLTRLEYMNRFTDNELVGIYSTAKVNPLLEVWLEKFKAAQEINSSDPKTVEGLLLLEAVGLLAQGRSMEILNGS